MVAWWTSRVRSKQLVVWVDVSPFFKRVFSGEQVSFRGCTSYMCKCFFCNALWRKLQLLVAPSGWGKTRCRGIYLCVHVLVLKMALMWKVLVESPVKWCCKVVFHVFLVIGPSTCSDKWFPCDFLFGRLSCCFTTAHLLKKFSSYDVLKRQSCGGGGFEWLSVVGGTPPQKVMDICEENHGNSSYCSQGAYQFQGLVVVWKILPFYSYLWKWSNLTNIFQTPPFS